MADTLQNAGYGGYYSQQQKGVGQYAYPQKKFPWLYVIIGIAALLAIVAISYVMFFMPKAPVLDVSPLSMDFQVSPGDIATSTVMISNPGNKQIQVNLQPNLPSWITIDKKSISLMPGESTTLTVKSSPSAESQTTSGSIYFSGTDIYISVQVEVLPIPEVSLSIPRTSFSVSEGEKTSVLATVSNIGYSNAVNASFSVVGLPSEMIKIDSTPFTVQAGKEVSKTLTVEIPKVAEIGDYEGMLALRGIGFSKNIPISLSVSQSVGILGISPSDLSGTRTSGSNLRLIVLNTGNGELTDISFAMSNTLKASLSVSPPTITSIGPGQSAEVILTVDGITGTKNGNIQVSAIDTHGNTQTKFITVAINVM